MAARDIRTHDTLHFALSSYLDGSAMRSIAGRSESIQVKKRILYVHHCDAIGGATISMLGIIEQLAPEIFEPIVLFNGPKGNASPLFTEKGIAVVHDERLTTYQHAQGGWISLRDLRPWEIITKALEVVPSAKYFEQVLREYRVDLVHLNTSVQIPAAIAAYHIGVPVVWHIREEIHPGYFGLRRCAVRKCFERFGDRIIAISKQNAAQLVSSPKTTVVYNSVAFERFDRTLDSTSVRKELDLRSDQPMVLMLGGVVQSKGADILLEAAELVCRVNRDVVFVIAGQQPRVLESTSTTKRFVRRFLERIGFARNVSRRCLALLENSDMARQVRFIGVRGDVPQLLGACSMLVWPAMVSHFARPIMEAGAMGKPVIASDFQSSREIVENNESGILVPPEDPLRLANAILRLLHEPQTAQRLGERGFQLALKRFDAKRNVAKIMDVYEEILGTKRYEGVTVEER
jgi:glycosyltransferase involved in cell wall biosynthesis